MFKSLTTKESAPGRDESAAESTHVYPTLESLVRLRFDARGFSLLPHQPVSSLLSGRHASRLRGRGLTFEELRDYRPGDDIRSIDWRATARLRKTHVRVYSEERERPVLLVVDQRSCMFFGSARTTKATAAAELAALAAWSALNSGDRVGAIIFGDDDIVEVRPHRSRENVLRICHELVRMNRLLKADSGRPNPDKLNAALRRAVSVANHDHLVVLATDYFGNDNDTHRHATRLASHNDVLATLVYDPLGASLPIDGGADVTDGSHETTVNVTARVNERYVEQFRLLAEEIRGRLRSIRIPVLPICTHESIVSQLLNALGERR
ncbi:uncharacterized protein (DUF58 family) [Rhodopirellula rubra]|uniref:Uncharacterized protein (DUF58 family) n=1 Tax=Aporhodopirellula rubra TaxID=980271 RepID=A0A7W5DWJ0_9BACT|nr:DUF58 domain-containing protein [Aporhodopirellula rubra]MBB3205845.1 uncharacterized protein (DUF58 family) [Aporhodopirellula rubra]